MSLIYTKRYMREYQALGTAGGLYHFRDEIMRGGTDAFFVMNAGESFQSYASGSASHRFVFIL